MPLLTQLNTLESSGLIRLAAVQPELEYLFRHALVQDAAYASLLKNDRKQLHLATCQAMEQLYPEQRDELVATLAYHYEKAEDNERAAHYFQRAGDLARDRYANVEALAFYQSALRLQTSIAASPHTLAQLHEECGDLAAILGQHDEARDQFDQVRALLGDTEPLWQARVHRKTGNTWIYRRQQAAAFQAFAAAEQALGAVPTEGIEAWQQEWLQIHVDRHWLLYGLNQVEELQASTDRVRPVLEQYGTAAQQANFYLGLLSLMHRLHRYTSPLEDIEYGKAGLAAAQRSGNPRTIASSEWVLGVAYLLRSDLAEAEHHLQAGLRIVEKVGDLVTEFRCLTYLVVVYRRKGDLATVRQLLPRLIKATTEGQAKEYFTVATAATAWLAWREGQLAEARKIAQEAFDAWQAILPMLYPFQWQALWLLIATTLRLGDIAAAVHYTQQLLAPEQQAVPSDIQPALEAALQSWADDQPEVTQRQLEQAVTQAQAQGYL
ncbi:MAG TPA: hypothetical protein VFZ34_31815 [Blastocatellia bacterium]|nr:hypothetical protein [Blastocatellia bacterium]